VTLPDFYTNPGPTDMNDAEDLPSPVLNKC